MQVNDARNQVNDADKLIAQKAREAENKLSSATQNTIAQAKESAKETRKEVNASMDNFDKTVERKASEAKTGISSWLGFGK